MLGGSARQSFKLQWPSMSGPLTHTKRCSKCNEEKFLINFGRNTSGRDPFDKKGYRLIRPECKDCTSKASRGKKIAEKIAKENGIPYIAPPDSVCAICNEPPKRGDGLVFDHDHTRNTFRGYCHNSCNRAMGVLGDDIPGMVRVINYLLKNESQPSKIVQHEDGTLHHSLN